MTALQKKKQLTYLQMIALGYFVTIAFGTLLLWLPAASRMDGTIGLSVALFTATSATCVTGLVIYDTYTTWTLFGQAIILVLIQTGGLGFMSMVTLVSFLLKRRIGLKERGLLKESVNAMYIGGIVRLMRKILIGTLLFELLGAIILSFRYIPLLGTTKGLYFSIFHSVSAFCNAGFDLMGRFAENSSLYMFYDDPVVILTVIVLIIVGGIGFFVWDDIMQHKWHLGMYKLHTKIVLSSTGILLIAGTLLLFLLEKNHMLADKTWSQGLLISLFASVTPRTAGFSTVDTASWTPASMFLHMLFMFIGGSPGSTAGGVKTTTMAVILISVWATIRRCKDDNIYCRRLGNDTLRKAVAVITINLMLIITAFMVITATDPSFTLSQVLFEVVSAVGTVGLSTGITGSLSQIARIMIILLMYCGRVGSLTFILVFAEQRTSPQIQNPIERINIG